MTSDDVTPEPSRHNRLSAGDPGGFPDWVHQLEREIRVSRAVRLRIRLARHTGKLLAGVGALLVLGLLVVGGTAGYRYTRRPGPKAYPTVTQPAGVHATTTASAPPAAGPFDGTPAAAFPEGAAGLTLPPAKRTGDFNAKQVSAGLTEIRNALVTARLDRAFMTSTDPEMLVRQLAPDARAGVRKDFTSELFANYATRLAPGAHLLKDQPRVNGRITYRAVRDPDGIRAPEVTTNFVWAYAFRSTSPVPGDGVVVVHDTVVWHLPHPHDVASSSEGLWLWESRSYGSNIDCATFAKGLLDVGTRDYAGPTPSGGPDSLYDPDRSLDIPSTCRTAADG